jgi:peptidoglycan L-alanyl-D-glutamate endopeptidase CwlK
VFNTNSKYWLSKLKHADSTTVGIGVALITFIGFLVSLRRGDPPGLSRSEQYIKTLEPVLQSRARQFIINAYAVGIPVIFTSGHRGYAEQQRLYEQGRTTEGPIVTDALPGSSWHNFGLAFDAAILDENDNPSWPENTVLWTKLGAIGAKLGLNHGMSFGDKPHFDYHPNLTLAQARAKQSAMS